MDSYFIGDRIWERLDERQEKANNLLPGTEIPSKFEEEFEYPNFEITKEDKEKILELTVKSDDRRLLSQT